MADVNTMPWLAAPREALLALQARGVHAALLHGPAGTGKWDLAMAMAAAALCEAPPAPGAACGSCASCHLLAAGNHPDLRVVVPDALAALRPGAANEEGEPETAEGEGGGKTRAKPSREIRIDQVRDLAGLAEISAHRGGYRVVVLGPAESLNPAAANALLKGLEEPPPKSLFLLVSDHLDGCLATIRSRCSLVRVPVPPREQALAWLEGKGVAGDVAQQLTEAGGAPLLALRESEDTLEPGVREVLLGLLRRGAGLAPDDIAAAVPRTVPIGASVDLFLRWGWDYFAFRLGAAVRYHPGEVAAFRALGGQWSLAAAGRWLDSLRTLKAVADHPLNARSAVEGVLLEYLASVRGAAAGA